MWLSACQETPATVVAWRLIYRDIMYIVAGDVAILLTGESHHRGRMEAYLS